MKKVDSSVKNREPSTHPDEERRIWPRIIMLLLLVLIIAILVISSFSGNKKSQNHRSYLPDPPIVTSRFPLPPGKTPYPSAKTRVLTNMPDYQISGGVK